ncbi:MAG: tetratricopeptide repeat protein [Bacteroidota bacterium]
MLFCVLLFVLLGCKDAADSTSDERFVDPRSQALLQQGTAALEQHEFEIALVFADSAERYTPELPDAAFLRGRIYSELGDYEKAAVAYTTTLERDPAYRGVWHNLGNNDFRINQFEDAIINYRKELAAHNAPMPWRGIGRAYVELGKVDSARVAFESAIQLDSTYGPAHFNLALLLEDEGKFPAALTHATYAASYTPDDWDYRYLMASLLATNGHNAEALPHLQAVTEHWPWHHASHYKLGQTLVRLGDTESGQLLIDEAEDLRAKDANIMQLLNSARAATDESLPHAALGSALRLVGRYEDAMRAYKIARHLDPANLEIQTNMANLMLLQGDTLGTIQAYQHILQQDPSFTGLWVNLGIVHAMAGQMQDAQAAWERAVTLDPENAQAKAYLARLR